MSSDRAAQLVEAGIWLKLSGDSEGANKLFERALKLDPDNIQALEHLAGSAELPEIPHVPEPPPPPPPRAEPDLDGDWGRLTGAPSPIPSIAPVTMESSKSGTMRLYPEDARPGTMQMFPEKKSKTTQLFVEKPELSNVPAPRTTLPQFGRDIVLEAAPAPERPSRATLPQFSRDIVIESEPAASVPPQTGHDLVIDAEPAEQPRQFGKNVVLSDTPAGENAADDTSTAWGWSPSAEDYTEPMVPRPSPALAPSAESAWDQRTNPGIKLEMPPDQGALDLIVSDSKITRAPPTAKDELKIILRGAKDLLDLDDHTGAMELIIKASTLAPTDPEVVALKERSEATLLRMFESKLGKIEAIPRVLLKDDEIIWLNLDHRAGFVLAQIDGTVTFDDLFSVSGMSRMDTARILAQLIDEGVISRG